MTINHEHLSRIFRALEMLIIAMDDFSFYVAHVQSNKRRFCENNGSMPTIIRSDSYSLPAAFNVLWSLPMMFKTLITKWPSVAETTAPEKHQ